MPESNSLDLSTLINWPREERNLEFKRSMSWSDAATKAKLTKSALAMANLRDGGHIVFGVERQADDSYVPAGMQSGHIDSFVQDELSTYFSEYADPYIEIILIKHIVDGKVFCIIRVNEFAELPVICKKDGAEKLRRGATYIRSRRLPETVEVPGQVEMREILDLAIEKRSRAFALQAARMNLARQSEGDEFIEQLKTLPETETLKKIRSMDYWTVWIRPTVFERARFQTLASCRTFVLSNAVSCEGWQYPLAHDELIAEGDDYITGYIEHPPFLETWTLFRSGQFIFNFALAEMFLGTQAWPTHPRDFVPGKGKRYFSIPRALTIVTCLYEFAARLAARQILDPSALLSIGIHGVGGRELSYVGSRPRIDGAYWSRADSINVDRSASSHDLTTNARELALDVVLEIFGKFGWTDPPRTLFAAEQSRLLSN